MKIRSKVVCSILLAMMLVMCLAQTALAGGNVTYDGGAQEFIFEPGSEYSPTDLFTDFKGVMPGDKLTQTVNVKNDASKDVEVKIYMRALGAHEGSEEFLSQLTLTVEQEGASKLFNAPANETAQLTDWVLLGTFKSGADVDLKVTLEVPMELSDDFESAVGYLDWQFKAEEYPVPTPTPSDEPTPTPTPDNPPKTGDDGQAVLYIIICIVSAAAVITILLIARKRRNKDAQ